MTSGRQEPLRAGLIGLGGVGRVHLEAYAQSRSVHVVAAADVAAAERGALAEAFGLRLYRNHEEMLRKEELDLACIATPASTHEEIAVACAGAGLHALCEKPLALTVESAERMQTCASRHGVGLCYGATYRFLPAILEARKLIQRGEIGDVLLMREELIGGSGSAGHQPLPVAHYPRGGPGGSGMGLVDHGIHLIDIFGWIIDSTIVAVCGRGNLSGDPPEVEIMDMSFANGARGLLTYCDRTFGTALPQEGIFSEGRGWTLAGALTAAGEWQCDAPCIHIYGSEGALRVFYYGNVLILNRGNRIRRVPLTGAPPPAHFAAQMDAFAQSIIAGEPPPTPATAGVAALRALLAVYESQRVGRRVDLPLDSGIAP